MASRSIVNALAIEALGRALVTYENPENRKPGHMLFPFLSPLGTQRTFPGPIIIEVFHNIKQRLASIPDGPVKKWAVEHTTCVLIKMQNEWILGFKVL